MCILWIISYHCHLVLINFWVDAQNIQTLEQKCIMLR